MQMFIKTQNMSNITRNAFLVLQIINLVLRYVTVETSTLSADTIGWYSLAYAAS